MRSDAQNLGHAQEEIGLPSVTYAVYNLVIYRERRFRDLADRLPVVEFDRSCEPTKICGQKIEPACRIGRRKVRSLAVGQGAMPGDRRARGSAPRYNGNPNLFFASSGETATTQERLTASG